MESIITCPNCGTKLIEYETGSSVGIGNFTEEDVRCIKCGKIIDSRLSQNVLATRYYTKIENN